MNVDKENTYSNNTSILRELEDRVREHPHKLLYAFLDIHGDIKESYTYREFYQRMNGIASHMHSLYSFKPGDRILLAYPPGLEMICAFFACVRLGLIPVPVYPPSAQGFESSLGKMRYIASDCKASAVLTTSSYYWSIKVNLSRTNDKSSLLENLDWIVSDDAGSAECTELPCLHSDILFLQYTSGSTSDPKGVMVTHKNMLHNCDSVVDHLPVGVSWLPQYHDMGLIGYYIFFALKGGTTYGFAPTDFIQRPALWLETISKYNATASSAPNFAYEYCLSPGKIPDQTLETLDLSSLKFLMTAAEPVNPEVYRSFLDKFTNYGLKPESFFAAYGLAEFTLAVSNYGRTITAFDAAAFSENRLKTAGTEIKGKSPIRLMSCGKPLGDTQIKIVDPLSRLEADKYSVGEIWVTGSSKSAGYWGKKEISSEIFEAGIENQNTGATWLRTGDLGFIHNGELYVCGRAKDMIIVRGLNYYPQDIESIIEEDHSVRKGCAAAFSVEEQGRERIVAVVGIKHNKKIPDTSAINNKLISYLGVGVDQFVFVPARTISKTSSGKIMRAKNKIRFLQNEHHVISSIGFKEEAYGQDPETILPAQGITALNGSGHHSLLFRYGLTGKENEALGHAGLDSIRLAEFAHDLKAHVALQGYEELSHEIDLRLLQKIAVSELAEILDGLRDSTPLSAFRFKKAFTRLHQEYTDAEKKAMKKDALLRITAPGEYPPIANPGNAVFLTGGTGFFGPFLIKSLLEQTNENIYVLVRAKTPAAGRARLREAFAVLNCPEKLRKEFEQRVVPLCGDIARINLGLTPGTWDFLASAVSAIYHNGAQVNYLLDYESMRQANVRGTAEIVRLAMASRSKILNHISTTFIFGWSVKDTLYEQDANENMENLDFGYSQSKWVSEKIIVNAMKKGLRARIFRPALLSPSVAGEGYNFDISIRLLAFMVKHAIGTSAKNQVSFTPADIAANNIVAISNIPESEGLTFHVTRDTFSSMPDVTDILSRFTGKPFRHFPLKQFVPEVVGRCKKDDLLFPLLNFLVRSESKISAMEFKRYDNRNYTMFRDQSPRGLKDVPLEDVVAGLFKFMLQHGIIDEKIKPEKYA